MALKTLDLEPPALEPRLFVTLTMEAPARRKEKKMRTDKKRMKLRLWLAFLVGMGALLVSFYSQAQSLEVPHLINFQSVLTDAGGVPLADGKHSVHFRLLSAAQQSLFEETQNLESVGGVVSAMVTAGSTEAKFLGVQVEGAGPETVMEIVSVPYSLVAEQALQVAPKSIVKESIAPKAITADLLADDVVQEILMNLGTAALPPTIVSKTQLDAVTSNYSGQSGASRIGVDTNFVYSRGPTVQNVLKDLDTAIHQRQVNLNVNLDKEIQDRVVADQSLEKSLNTETDARKLADATHAATTTGVHGLDIERGGQIVGTSMEQTLVNKTLIKPVIQDFSRAQHDHSTAEQGGEISDTYTRDTELAQSIECLSKRLVGQNCEINASVSSASISASLSSSLDVAESNASALEARVRALESQLNSSPKIVAWGRVYARNGTAVTLAGLNVASINPATADDGGFGWRIVFRNAISGGYVVVATGYERPSETHNGDLRINVQESSEGTDGFTLKVRGSCVVGDGCSDPTSHASFGFAVIQ